ncbi:MAG: T9SS type A sorting domain-containing protein [Bacteroidales bacterium]|jgi:hypothetical protein|nr:T9SS type A sorting domain-containing protein [Bacteroidales bacterium]
MKKITLIIVFFIVLHNSCFSQIFTGDGIAIHKDSSIIVSWAVSANVERGYINIADTSFLYTERGITDNKAFNGSVENVIGKANGKFLSLGDGGHVILQFEKPITNGLGPDFAVFENVIFTPPNQTELAFVELAFVEVSSDGINYERFPAVSNLQYEQQVETFDAVDWTLFENFAGVYPVFYGYPFDLDDIPGEVVDKLHITHVKIIDAIGNINPDYASYDSKGNIVNDPWPTPFATCGFDLDAVGVIHEIKSYTTTASENNTFVYPNPAKDFINIYSENLKTIKLYDLTGREMLNIPVAGNEYYLNVENMENGIYIIVLECSDNIYSKKIIIGE